MELSDNEISVCYLAICNSIKGYSDLITNENLEEEEKELAEYILSELESLEIKLSNHICDDSNDCIKRPKWN